MRGRIGLLKAIRAKFIESVRTVFRESSGSVHASSRRFYKKQMIRSKLL
jgi:hypothetical protein